MTTVETSDSRTILGVGKSINRLKFPIFHIFETNWRLKIVAKCSELENEHRLSLKLKPKPKSAEEIWEIEAIVGVTIESLGIEEFWFDWTFSNARKGVELQDIGIWSELQEKGGGVQMDVKIQMQIRRSSGVQLRNFIDFSQNFPIFSDAVILIQDPENAENAEKFYVNRMILSMASPVIFRKFLKEIDSENSKNLPEIRLPEVEHPRDFRRILNLIYPPHLPPKQWIKEHDKQRKIENIRRILQIAQALEISIIFEKTDEFCMKFCNFQLGEAILLAQEFGLRRLMGSKIHSIQTIQQIATCPERRLFSNKTKSMILDRILTL